MLLSKTLPLATPTTSGKHPVERPGFKCFAAVAQSPAIQHEQEKTQLAPGFVSLRVSSGASRRFKDGFEEEYRQQGLRWEESPTEFEVASAARFQRAFPEVANFLQDFKQNKDAPSAIVIRGLPTEDNLPATIGNAPIKREGQLVEALMAGVAAVLGVHVFIYEAQSKQYGGATSYMHDVFPKAKWEETLTVFASKAKLPLHREFPFGDESRVLQFLMLAGVRPDRNKEAKTTVVDNRYLVSKLDPRDVKLLRENNVEWNLTLPNGVINKLGPKPGITGPEDDPICNITYCDEREGATVMKSFMSSDNPEALAAYKRMLEVADSLSEGVCLEGGDILVINNSRAVHGRAAFTGEQHDGYGRWFKRAYLRDIDVNKYPTRIVPNP